MATFLHAYMYLFVFIITFVESLILQRESGGERGGHLSGLCIHISFLLYLAIFTPHLQYDYSERYGELLLISHAELSSWLSMVKILVQQKVMKE